MNPDCNPVCWFEIYVSDLERAKKFYETVFDTELEPLPSPDPDLEMLMFPGGPGKEGAAGALAKMKDCEPGNNSTLIYFSCADCGIEAGRVEAAGGQIVKPKFSIGEYGDIAMFLDTEGNMVGLHNPAKDASC